MGYLQRVQLMSALRKIVADKEIKNSPEKWIKIIDKFLRKRHINPKDGGCGLFAILLNRMLGGKGKYIILMEKDYFADGEDCLDHVILKYNGVLYDYSGSITSIRQLIKKRIWEQYEVSYEDKEEVDRMRSLVARFYTISSPTEKYILEETGIDKNLKRNISYSDALKLIDKYVEELSTKEN